MRATPGRMERTSADEVLLRLSARRPPNPASLSTMRTQRRILLSRPVRPLPPQCAAIPGFLPRLPRVGRHAHEQMALPRLPSMALQVLHRPMPYLPSQRSCERRTGMPTLSSATITTRRQKRWDPRRPRTADGPATVPSQPEASKRRPVELPHPEQTTPGSSHRCQTDARLPTCAASATSSL